MSPRKSRRAASPAGVDGRAPNTAAGAGDHRAVAACVPRCTLLASRGPALAGRRAPACGTALLQRQCGGVPRPQPHILRVCFARGSGVPHRPNYRRPRGAWRTELFSHTGGSHVGFRFPPHEANQPPKDLAGYLPAATPALVAATSDTAPLGARRRRLALVYRSTKVRGYYRCSSTRRIGPTQTGRDTTQPGLDKGAGSPHVPTR